nr:type II toxin-antitoxin system VapC family toxin [Oceanococcus sp. HetDA_MAG_MS8]
MNYLIDTNILSELRKPPGRRNQGVEQWFGQADPDSLFLSVLVVGEIRKGIEARRVSDPVQGVALEAWLSRIIDGYFDRILPIDLNAAQLWGRAQCIRPFPVIDGLLAATAQARGMVLVTRNVKDLDGWPVPDLLMNPFIE